LSTRTRWVPSSEAQRLHQARSPEEDRQRTNIHYERPAEFFSLITGGEWNVYSANIWTDGRSGAADPVTASQEAKLDLLAELMELRPGERLLDVGCGWGGPLVYLAKRFGLRGVGLTLSPTQKAAADQRSARHRVDVTVHERHWKEYEDEQRFDAVMTDEVIVHFEDLGGYFAKVRSLLQPHGRMLNKELHFTHSAHAEMTRAMAFINDIYGGTGNYRTLSEELRLTNQAGFAVERVHQIDRVHYQRTLDRWLSNMFEHRARLEELVGKEDVRRFRAYLKLVRQVLGGRTMTLDVVVSRPLA
jgi:cyclopropane-fatty-acyl-phospholipid synthase